MKKVKPKESFLESTIRLRKNGIKRMEERKKTIRAEAEEKCAVIDKELAKKRVLLKALENGSLQP